MHFILFYNDMQNYIELIRPFCDDKQFTAAGISGLMWNFENQCDGSLCFFLMFK